MKFILAAVVVAASLVSSALAGGDETTPLVSCGNGIPGGINCMVSKKDEKEARLAYRQGVKLEDQNHLEGALEKFDRAARLDPQNRDFLTAREVVKARLVFNHMQRGNVLLLEDAQSGAAAEFRAALDLDPENRFAQERLGEATMTWAPQPAPALSTQLQDSGEMRLQPTNDRATFHFSGDARDLFTQLAAAYKMTVQFDDSLQRRQVRFNLDDADFFTALDLACRASKSMWAVLDAHQFLIAADKPENHKQFDRMSLRTFILPSHSTTQEVTEVVNLLRSVLELKYVQAGQTSGTVEVRGPQPILEACAQLLDQLDNQRPQVMLEMRVYQISHQLTRNIGLHIPNTFNLYNIPAAAILGLGGGQNIQQLINQLISSGGINQAGSSALSGLLAQLGGQQNSIFSQPLATFGGGLTFSGLSLDQLSAALSLNESWVRSLEDMTMRASQGNDATFHLGERYPILNASYAPIYNSPQISQVLGNQSYVPPFPSVSYEDLGLQLKAKPIIHGDRSVSLQLELQVRSLTGESNNGVPVISNREYKGSINLKDGEPAVVAGQISRTDTFSMSGIPGLGAVPLLNQAMVNNTKQEDDDELMVVITPRVLANTLRTAPEIWISQN